MITLKAMKAFNGIPNRGMNILSSQDALQMKHKRMQYTAELNDSQDLKAKDLPNIMRSLLKTATRTTGDSLW